MGERKLRWNRFTDTGEQIRLRHKYVVAILNEPREIQRIRQRFLEQMIPVDDINDILDASIPGSKGLHCRIFSFSSDQDRIRNFNKIYANLRQFRKDRDLYERSEKDLLDYVSRLSGS